MAKIIATTVPRRAPRKREAISSRNERKPRGVDQNDQRSQPCRRFPEIIVYEQKRISGDEITPPTICDAGLRICHSYAPNQSYAPAMAARARPQLMLVAVGKVTFIKQ